MERSVFLLVFTDVDGTLLDHDTYSFSAAQEALALLARESVPLILCSSKTRAELEALQEELGIGHPFISENGGALFVPDGYFPFEARGARRVGRYRAIEFGLPYSDVVARLRATAEALGIDVTGFADLDDEGVSRACGLPIERARLARQREYDEPFVVHGPRAASARQELFAALQASGLRCTTGGRFEHVSGRTDKARGLAVLRMLYRKAQRRRIVTVALGDGPNDLPLLREVDIPIVVRNPSGKEDNVLRRGLPSARMTSAPGPSGWTEAVGELVRARD